MSKVARMRAKREKAKEGRPSVAGSGPERGPRDPRTAELQGDLEVRGLMEQVQLRAVDGEARAATFVAATEGPVRTWMGTEHLNMDGLDLSRFAKNPVILDTHNRYELESILGRGEVAVVDRELHVTVHFAGTERAETAWQLARDGFVRAMSVGFFPRRVLEIEEGETYELGGQVIQGPANVMDKWELFEISLVPVPANADAVRRSWGVMDARLRREAARDLVLRAVALAGDACGADGIDGITGLTGWEGAGDLRSMGARGQRRADEGDLRSKGARGQETFAQQDPDVGRGTFAQQDAQGGEDAAGRVFGMLEWLFDGEESPDEFVQLGLEKDETMGQDDLKKQVDGARGVDAESVARAREAAASMAEERRAAAIRALSCPGLEEVAQRCILQGLSVEDARQQLLEAFEARATPAGTPGVAAFPPVKGDAPGAAQGPAERTLEDLDDDELVRAICG